MTWLKSSIGASDVCQGSHQKTLHSLTNRLAVPEIDLFHIPMTNVLHGLGGDRVHGVLDPEFDVVQEPVLGVEKFPASL